MAVGRGPRSKECAFWKDYLPKLVAATSKLRKLFTVYFSQFDKVYSTFLSVDKIYNIYDILNINLFTASLWDGNYNGMDDLPKHRGTVSFKF